MQEDPGQWQPVDPSVLAGRRKVRVRRAGEDAPAAPTTVAPSSNPFSGISLFPTAPTPAAASNPFSGISLVPPSSSEPSSAPKDEAKGPNMSDVKDTPPQASEDAPKTSTPAVASFGFGSYSSNAFASLTNGVNATPVSGFGGGFGGGGFGSAISKAPTATPPASPLFGALATPGTSGFAFTTGAFPNIAPQAFKTPVADGDDAEGDESVEVFADSTAEFKPLVNLPQAQKTVTGEEEEMTIYSASDAILYEFFGLEKKWVERGKGEFKLNVEKPSGSHSVQKARMILRQSGSLRLLLNASVHDKMVCNLMAGDVGVSFAAHNAAAAAAAPSLSPDQDKPKTPPASPLPSGSNIALTTWAVKIRGRGVDPATRLFSLINQHKEALTAQAEANGKEDKVASANNDNV